MGHLHHLTALRWPRTGPGSDPPGAPGAGEFNLDHDLGRRAMSAGLDRGDGELVLAVGGARDVRSVLVAPPGDGDLGVA